MLRIATGRTSPYTKHKCGLPEAGRKHRESVRRTKSMNVTQKILSAHLISGELKPGSEIAIRIDQTLTQDSTGTMAYLQFEAMDVKRVKTERSMAYIDHNTLQTGFENADDHAISQASPASTASI